MFGNNTHQPGIKTFFGPNGNAASVFGSGGSTFSVMGTKGHDGMYVRQGNTVFGPDGVHTVLGQGPIKTVFSPGGECHTVIENGFGGTIL